MPYSYGLGNRSVFGPSIPLLSTLETGTNSVFEQIRKIVQAITSIAHFLDSTVYAGWSSINALGMVAENFRQLKQNIISKWIEVVRMIFKFFGRTLSLHSPQPQHLSGSKNQHIAILLASLVSVTLYALRDRKERQAIVTHEYISTEPGHLSLMNGQKLKILAVEDEWAYAEDFSGRKGCFPLSHIRPVQK